MLAYYQQNVLAKASQAYWAHLAVLRAEQKCILKQLKEELKKSIARFEAEVNKIKDEKRYSMLADRDAYRKRARDYFLAHPEIGDFLNFSKDSEQREAEITALIEELVKGVIADIPLERIRNEAGNGLLVDAFKVFKQANTVEQRENNVKVIERLYERGATGFANNDVSDNSYSAAQFSFPTPLSELAADKRFASQRLRMIEAALRQHPTHSKFQKHFFLIQEQYFQE